MIMADAKGHGYQRPSSPAPVSAPGRLSQRTDGGPGAMQGAKYVSGLPYGEGAEFQDMQSMAPMEAAPSIPSATSVGAAPSQIASGSFMQPSDINLVPLNAPTQRKYEPVTAGVDVGAGPGSSILPSQVGIQGQYQSAVDLLNSVVAADPNNPALQYLSQRIKQAY